MAFPVTLNGRTYTLADFEGQNYVDGLPDAFEDFVTHAGDVYNTTSSSLNSVGTGSKTFTTADSGKPYVAGTPLRIAYTIDPENIWMSAIVTSYSGTTLVVDVQDVSGSGGYGSWNITVGGATGPAGSGLANVVDDTTPQLGGNLDLNGNNITGTGNLDVTGSTTTDSLIVDGSIEEQQYNLTGTVIDPANGTIQYKTLSANTTFTESLSDGEYVILMIDDGTAYTITWPTITWVGGSAPTLETTGYNVINVWQVNGTLYGAFVGAA